MSTPRAIPYCQRRAGALRPETDPALAPLCRRHRTSARALAAWHRTGVAVQVERLRALALRPWCERCRLRHVADVRPDTAPGTEMLCTGCRSAVRRRTVPIRGRLRGMSVTPGREHHTALLAQREQTAATLALYERPRTRGDCLPGGCNAERPCPWVGCRWHLALSVTDTGSLRLEHPGREVWELKETCALDVAEGGGPTLEDVGELVNLTRERVRQIEVRCTRRLRRSAAVLEGLDPSDRPGMPAAPVGLRWIPAVASAEYGELDSRDLPHRRREERVA